MTRAEVFTKYEDVITAVSKAEDVDIHVAENMVSSVCQVRLGQIEGEEMYKGVPEDFDCKEYLKDFLGDTNE